MIAYQMGFFGDVEYTKLNSKKTGGVNNATHINSKIPNMVQGN